MKTCFNCRNELTLGSPPGRNDTCPFCRADLRCCMNCAFYDTGAYNQCREPQSERVLEKEKGNFCDYFRFKVSAAAPEKMKSAAARDRMEALFKKQ